MNGSAPESALVLEIWRDDPRLKVACYERRHEANGTLRPYQDCEVAWHEVEDGCRDLRNLLRRSNKRGLLTSEILDGFKKSGQLLFELLLPPNTRKLLDSTSSTTLFLHLDEKLVHIPWEMLFTGREFLCLRFDMGRIVITRQSVAPARGRPLAYPWRVLILADPEGNLEGSYREGRAIRDFLDARRDVFHADFKSHPVGCNFVKKNLREYDFVHYAGHAEYDADDPAQSSWLLSDGRLEAGEITRMEGPNPMPALVFANACHTARSGEWAVQEGYEQEIFGLANAYLLAGVQHYIGTLWEVAEDASLDFARNFYRYLTDGANVGAAVRRSREALIESHGERAVLWACYVLYGDPTVSFTRAQTQSRPEVSTSAVERAPTARISRKSRRAIVLGGVLLLAIVAAWYAGVVGKLWPINPSATRELAEGRFDPTARPEESLALTMNVIGQRKEPDGEYAEVLVGDGSVLHSHDNFQVHLMTNRPAFVYVLLYDSQGKASQLFPRAEIDTSNRIHPDRNVFVPGRDLWFWLDENPGTETLYVLASENPMSDIEGLLAQMNAAGEDGKKRISEEIHEKIAFVQRGVGGITQGRPFTYTLSDGKKIEKMTAVVTGSGALVRAVSFEHR